MTAHITPHDVNSNDLSAIVEISETFSSDVKMFEEEEHTLEHEGLTELESQAYQMLEIIQSWLDLPQIKKAIEAKAITESEQAEHKAWMKIEIDENDHNEYDENESKQILITDEQKQKMLDNNAMRQGHADNVYSPYPVVKLFNPNGGGTWLLTEIAMNNQDLAFGLCDLGMGFPELGWVSIAELKEVRTPFGLGIERDAWFEASKTLTDYTIEATRNFRIMA